MTVSRWRVAVTRDEDPTGPLSAALRGEGFEPLLCPVSVERPPADPSRLLDAAHHLDRFDWVICASARAVRALVAARRAPWPAGVRAAAVGARTAAALTDAGAARVFVAPEAGAEALWAALANEDQWRERRVLMPNVSGGRQDLIDGLVAAGAAVAVVEAYSMQARAAADIATTWQTIAPESAVLASPSVAARLIDAVGAETLRNLRAVVAIGHTTAAALRVSNVPATVAPSADFPAIVRHLAAIRASRDLV